MTVKTAGVIGAVTLLAGAGAAQAAPPVAHDLATVMTPTSYAELLQPIPNATELLKASDAQALSLAQDGDATLEQAQFYYHHHHHHHHHGYFRGPFFHHHHHGFYRRFYHHHHHHHHHFYRDYY